MPLTVAVDSGGGCSRNPWPGARHRGICPAPRLAVDDLPDAARASNHHVCGWPASGPEQAVTMSCSDRSVGIGSSGCREGKILSRAGRDAILGPNHIIGFACLDGTTFPGLAAELHAAARASSCSAAPEIRVARHQGCSHRPAATSGICHRWRRAAPASRHACASLSGLL